MALCGFLLFSRHTGKIDLHVVGIILITGQLLQIDILVAAKARGVLAQETHDLDRQAHEPAREDMEIQPLRLKGLLPTLEHFVARLGDKSIDSKTLQPLVEELSARKDELSSFYRGLPEDHPLKAVVGDVLDTVFSALGQYHRGDFGS